MISSGDGTATGGFSTALSGLGTGPGATVISTIGSAIGAYGTGVAIAGTVDLAQNTAILLKMGVDLDNASNSANSNDEPSALASGSSPRYNGPKPQYEINDKHVKLRRGQNATKLPSDAKDVFKNAVPDDAVNPKNWFGKNKDGKIYRYSGSNGKAHFSGIDGEGSGTRNITKYAKDRLSKL